MLFNLYFQIKGSKIRNLTEKILSDKSKTMKLQIQEKFFLLFLYQVSRFGKIQKNEIWTENDSILASKFSGDLPLFEISCYIFALSKRFNEKLTFDSEHFLIKYFIFGIDKYFGRALRNKDIRDIFLDRIEMYRNYYNKRSNIKIEQLLISRIQLSIDLGIKDDFDNDEIVLYYSDERENEVLNIEFQTWCNNYLLNTLSTLMISKDDL